MAKDVIKDAIARLHEARELRVSGRVEEALAVGRAGLVLLSDPTVDREDPVEGTALIGLTFVVEELARDLEQPGAERHDLLDTLTILKRLAAADQGPSRHGSTRYGAVPDRTRHVDSVSGITDQYKVSEVPR